MSTPTLTLGFLLSDAARLYRKRFEQRARGLGFTRAQFQVLATLYRAEGIQQGRLADIMEIEPITLVRLIDKLEGRGLIERRQHPTDRRIWQLYLTDTAHPLLDTMLEIGDATRLDAVADISESEEAALMGLLATIKSNLSACCSAPAVQAPATQAIVKEVSHG